jgi:hypothetical protein
MALNEGWKQELCRGMIYIMQTPEELLLEKNSLLERGLDPEMVENLKESQEEYRKMGLHKTLEEVFYLEVDDTSILDEPSEEEKPSKTLAQVYQQASSALTLQNLEDNSTDR